MKVTVKKGSLRTLKEELVLVPLFQNNDKPELNKTTQFLSPQFKKIKNTFSANFKTVAIHKNLVFIGLGERKNFSAVKLIQAIEYGISILKTNRVSTFSAYLSSIDLENSFGQIITRAFGNQLYSFQEFKTGKKQLPPSVILYVNSQDELKKLNKEVSIAVKINEAVSFARDLGNYPPNELTATRLAEYAQEMCKEQKLSCTVWGRKELEKHGFGSFLSVNDGSHEPPTFTIVEYNKDKKDLPLICLVGKGITFDTGGINLKQKSLPEMKFDMCGAAMVLATTHVASALKLPIRLVTLVPSTDNRPGNRATLPSAIVKSYSGKTIDVQNTDAEGRLILCDALSYAGTFKPDAIIDAATLTGACGIALGPWFAAVLGNDDTLLKKIKVASHATGERVWQLPLTHDHLEALKSKVADIQNVSNPPGGAGTSTAGKFLEFFVPKNTPWAHLDIASVAWKDFIATGFGIALLTEVLANWNR